jgi:hypothetical protein
MRLLQLVVLVAAAFHASAFATKNRESTRPAFKAALAGSSAAAAAAPAVQSSEQQEVVVTREEQQQQQVPVFAFAGQAMVPVHVVDYDDNEAVIGYTTGLVACVVSLALGFSLGYGAI